MQNVTNDHSILAPSSAERWVLRCAASPKAEHGKREVDSTSALEGTALHEVAFQVLGNNATVQAGDIVEGVVMTDEGLDSVSHYIQYVNSVRGKNAQLEKRVDCKVIHPLCFGTPDYWEFFEREMILEITDYKNGRVDVSPYENWQMLVYLSGIMAEISFKLPFLDTREITIRITIVQPNSNDGGDPIKQWVLTGAKLANYATQARNAAHLAMSDNPICTPTANGCKNCKARLTCDAFNETLDNLAVCIVYAPAPVDYDPGFKLKQIRELKTMVSAMEKAADSEALALLQDGVYVTGFELGSGRDKLAWKGTIKETVPVAEVLGVDIMKVPERITPTQAKAKFKKAGVPEDLFKGFTEYKPGKPKVVPVDLSKTMKAFGKQ